MYGSFSFSKYTANPTGLKTAALYPNCATGLYFNHNMTQETAKMLLKKPVTASDAATISRHWQQEQTYTLLAETDKRATVLLTLLQEKKSSETIINRFMNTPQLRKSKKLTEYIVTNYLDQLPVNFTDSWYETVAPEYKSILVARPTSTISDETILQSSHDGHLFSTSEKSALALLAARPNIVLPLVKRNSGIFKTAIWSTYDAALLQKIATELLAVIETKLAKSGFVSLVAERNALNVLLLDHPLVPLNVKRHCVAKLTELSSLAHSRQTSDFFKDMEFVLSKSLKGYVYTNIEHILRSASTPVITRYVETYKDDLADAAVKRLANAYVSVHGFCRRNFNGEAVKLLRSLQKVKKNSNSTNIFLKEALAEIDDLGYENYCRNKMFVYTYSLAFPTEVDTGRARANVLAMNSTKTRFYESTNTLVNVAAYVDETLRDNEAQWRTFWELADTFTGTVEELLVLTKTLNN